MANITDIMLSDLKHTGDLVQALPGSDLAVISGLENVRLALLRRLSTEPGSLAHRPDYGVGIKRWQNAPMTLANQQAIALRIAEQFKQDPRVVKVLGCGFNVQDNTPSQMTVSIRIQLVGYGEQTFGFQPYDDLDVTL